MDDLISRALGMSLVLSAGDRLSSHRVTTGRPNVYWNYPPLSQEFGLETQQAICGRPLKELLVSHRGATFLPEFVHPCGGGLCIPEEV